MSDLLNVFSIKIKQNISKIIWLTRHSDVIIFRTALRMINPIMTHHLSGVHIALSYIANLFSVSWWEIEIS